MSKQNWPKVKEVFHEALRLDAGERDRFLDKACDGDLALRLEVESLLISLTDAKNFLEQPILGEPPGPGTEWQFEPGRQISHYKIVSQIGTGGMGEVYLAEDQQLRRQVALKILPEQMTANGDRVRRFQREAEAVSALNHPNILTIFEFGADDGVHILASEFVKGETLRTRLGRGPLPLREALDIAIQIASALNAAHEARVVHRDIKPENVMIRDDGYVKVLDFGLAKLSQTDSSDPDAQTRPLVFSQPGMILGTASYMSPEQARGKSIDARSDIFSLGVVLYEMLSGRKPFAGESTSDVIAAIIQTDPEPVSTINPDVPPKLDRIVAKALQKDRSDRYQTTPDLLLDLKQVEKDLGVDDRSVATTTDSQVDERTKPLLVRKTRRISRVGRPTLLLLAILGFLIAAGLGAYWYYSYRNGPGPIESIAVMPFVNQSGNPDVEYLSDGMTETLINGLSELPNLNVKARSSVFRYKGKDIELPKIAEELNVQAVLTGRIVLRGDNLTLSWDLVDANTETHLAGGQYNRRLTDLIALQNEIARDVSRKLGARLSVADEQKITKTYTTNPEAYQLYLKGRFHTLKNTRLEHLRAIPYLEKAIEIDPNYALAYVGLADANRGLSLAGEMRPTDYFPKAKAAAQRALEIDGTLAEAHGILGFITGFYDWDWAGAENHCKRALELDPDSGDAHSSYAAILSNVGRHQEAVAEAKRATELEPLNLRNTALEAAFLIGAGQPDEALSILNKVFELDPNYWFAHQFAAQAYIDKGQFEKAEAAARKSLESYDQNSRTIANLGYALARSGKRAKAQAEVEKLVKLSNERYVSPYSIALLYNGLGERNETLKWLERGIEQRDPRMTFLTVDRKWDNLRSDPRFSDLVRSVGLPQ